MLKTVSAITNAIGALNYKGTWNASTNTPTLASGVGTKGDYYVVSVAGSTTLDGISNWGVGDWVTFNGVAWQRVEGGADGNFVNLSATGTSTLGNTAIGRAYVTDGGTAQVGGDTPLGMINSQGYASASTMRWAFGPSSQANDSGKSKMWAFFVNKPADPGQNSEVRLETYTGFNNSIPSGAIPTANWATYLRMTLGGALNPGSNNTQTIGSATYRWNEIFCTNSTINTSDETEKTDIEFLDEAEKRVAIKIKSLIKKFRFKDAVASKGDNARIHVGVMAQDVRQAFVDECLDPERYSMFCSDTWYEYNGQPVQVDENGQCAEVHWELNGVVVDYDADGNLPDGAEMVKTMHQATPVTKLGVRYGELFAFMIAAI